MTIVDAREAFADKLIGDLTTSLETLSVFLGLELGLYAAIAGHGSANEAELAERAGIAPRYAREWLEQQASAGYLRCDDVAAPAAERRYRLAEGHAEVLLDKDSPYHAAPGIVMLAGIAQVLPDLIEAYRTGGGVPYHAFGRHIRHGIAHFNRPAFLHEYTAKWLPAMPDVDARLRFDPPANVLDLGCGLGTSSIVLAQAYPNIRVLGVDLDAESIAEARAAAERAGVADRVSFVVGDAAAPREGERYDLVTVFEALHDMGDPEGTLRAARSVLAEGGSMLIADERVADELTTPADLLERMQFGFSVLHCLPATMAENPVEAAGTILRTPTVRRWAENAGFTKFEVLPIDFPFWRFYRLSG